MDSLGRRSGRQMARIRRQRSQEWREREYSSSDNDDAVVVEGDKYPSRYVDERVIQQYEKDVKAGLDARNMAAAAKGIVGVLERGRSGGHPSSIQPQPLLSSSSPPLALTLPLPQQSLASTIQTVENRTYAPLSGSDGDTETDNGHSPIQMLLGPQQQQQQQLINILPVDLKTGHRILSLNARDPSTSSSDNNSDITYPDSDIAAMRSNGLTGARTDSIDSPPEPAPPEVPPRGISMHHSDLSSLRTPRDILVVSNVSRSPVSGTLINDRTVTPDSSVLGLPNQQQQQPHHHHHHHQQQQQQPQQHLFGQQPQSSAGGITLQNNVLQHQIVHPMLNMNNNNSISNNNAHHHHHHHHHHNQPLQAPTTLLPATVVAVHPVRNKGSVGTTVGAATGAATAISASAVAQPPSTMTHLQSTTPQTGQSCASPFAVAHFHIQKSCSRRCSWKCIAICLIFVSVLLMAAVAYFGAVSTMTLQLENNPACILVEESQLSAMEGFETSSTPTTRVPMLLYPTKVAPNDHNLWPVMEFSLGERVSREILPHGFWNVQLKQTQASFVRLNISLPTEADLALYARRHVPPTITHYDFTETILGNEQQQHHNHHRHKERSSDKNVGGKMSRSNRATAEVSVLHHLDPGWWFFSIYNDNGEQNTVSFVAEIAVDVSTHCPNNCHSHGACSLGKCECYQGYMGESCEHSLCPVLCSNHGTYSGGVCHCERGWKGTECGVPELECEVADCSGRGDCQAGVCMCYAGFKGRHCEEVNCLDPACADHGFCMRGRCICNPGWSGDNCSQVDNRLVQCLPNCSGHGTFDLDRGRCLCDQYWIGSDCTEAACSADCGPFGKCVGEECQCSKGWTGSKCDQKLCDPRCSEHGQCNNGTCVCIQGWNGRHCTLEGCPRDCTHHGDCVTRDGEFACVCHDGWDGLDCSVPLEKDCADRLDNDNDGVVDCADSECCGTSTCEESMMCLTTADPVDVLYRKQPPSVTASFYQRMKFLIEDNSVQSYVNKDEYSESKFWSAFLKSRVSIIRGRVVNRLVQGLIGVRVSVYDDNRFGFTVSRDQGWFDIMVNGGGAVTLHFQRSPFEATKKRVMVPWNQIVVMDGEAVMVRSKDEFNPSVDNHSGADRADDGDLRHECLDHDHTYMVPAIHETWRPGMIGGCPDRRVVYAETQVVQESVTIPGSDLHLLYQSSSSPGYHGALYIRLTPESVPATLTTVHLRVIVEGVVLEKRFEADPNVTHMFTWNKRNVYKQKVYGIASAKVSVGYQYSTCADLIWVTQAAVLQGYDMDVSEIGGWNLDVHHRFNFQDGVFQKGDGTTVYFAREPNVVHAVMGNGEQRPLDCDECNGMAKDQKLLSPVALTSGPDGSIYVGDFNLIRRVSPKGLAQTLLKLSASQMSFHYHLAVHPIDGSLYMSNPEKGQVLRVVTEYEHGDTMPLSRVEVALGSELGERCVVGDRNSCGDGRPARDAKLAYPKGMTITSDGVLYFADGINIRMVDKKGIVHTLIGSHHHHRKHRKTLPCNGAIPASEVQLLWPTEVTHSPLDGALYFIDDNLVLKLTKDQQVLVVVGRPLHCPEVTSKNLDSNGVHYAQGATFGSISGLAFVPDGNLLFVEVDSNRVNVIHKLSSDGRLNRFAGSVHRCDCTAAALADGGRHRLNNIKGETNNCSCLDTSKYSLAMNIRLFAVSAVAVNPEGVVYVADHGSLRLLALQHYLPKPSQLGDYEIVFPDMQEVYVFNRYGQHTTTRNILTGKMIYTFLYSVNTSFGKLSTVTDASGNKLSFLRDYSGKVTTIENAQGQKFRVHISKTGLMENLVTFSDFRITFKYQGGTALLTGRSDSPGNTYTYVYDDDGRLTEAVGPTGQSLAMKTRMSPEGAIVTVAKGEDDPYTLLMLDEFSIVTIKGASSEELKTYSNGTSVQWAEWGYSSEVTTAPHLALELSNPVQAEMFFAPVGWTVSSGRLLATVSWRYGLMGDPRTPHERLIERQLWVNNASVLTVEYDQTMRREVFYDRDRYSVFAVQYDSAGKPVQWVPSIGGLPVNIMYDKFGRLFSWQWGNMGEEFSYDRQGLLTEIKYEEGATFSYEYAENSLPVKFVLPSKRQFMIHYDHHGSLKYVVSPGGGQHHFGVQLSLGFWKLIHKPPGFESPLIRTYDEDGHLTSVIYPDGSGRVIHRYGNGSRLLASVYGRTEIVYSYTDDSGLLSEVNQKSGEFEYRIDYKYEGVFVTEERHRFGSRTGLNNAKFAYEYDSNFRLASLKGRIGGQDLTSSEYAYGKRSGLLVRMGRFHVSSTGRPNETSLWDDVATFNRTRDVYFRDTLYTMTIDRTEVFRLEVDYDRRNRIASVRTHLRKMGSPVANTDAKNYTYDEDGQLVEVVARDKWRFEYDLNGNMISMNFMGHVIPLQYNDMERIAKYGEMSFQVDDRGYIRRRGEEHFYYDASDHLIRATQAGRYDVRYDYDANRRLVVRRDHFGNVTQFFYANRDCRFQVTHIYNPRDGRTMGLIYDDQARLVYVQTGAHRYYVATDTSRSPVVLFSKYGEVVREMARSAYGHIVYDTNPFIYMPVDYQGGVLDSVTGLVHLEDGVYDPLYGHWMTPRWDAVVDYLDHPHKFHLFRINGNDPINAASTRWFLTDHVDWLRHLGYDAQSLVPHLNAKIHRSRCPLQQSTGHAGLVAPPIHESVESVSGAGCRVRVRESNILRLSSVPSSATSSVKKEPLLQRLVPRLHAAAGAIGRGIVVSRSTIDRKRAVVHAAIDADAIVRDVVTSVLDQSYFLDVMMMTRGQDSFFFVKESAWQATADWAQLQRLGSILNYTMSEPDVSTVDVRIHTAHGAVLNVRYGTTYDRERQRLLHVAKKHAVTEAWARERHTLATGYSGSRDWTPSEVDQILQSGSTGGYDANYVHDVTTYPELADDPLNIAFGLPVVGAGADQRRYRR